MPSLFRYGLPFAFAALLLLAWADVFFLGAGTQVRGFDNRAGNPPPTFDWQDPEAFPPAAEQWFNDHFPWRGFFQRFNGQLRAWTGARSPLPDKVVFGKDDWLFKGGLQMDLYRGKRRFTPAELQQVVAELTARRDSIEARGGRYYLAIPPLKHHVYPHLLPDHVRQLNPAGAVVQLQQALQRAGVSVVDLHAPLMAYARRYPPAALDTTHLQTTDLYYRTDHHWTVRAGFLAAAELLRRFRDDGLAVSLPDTADYAFTTRPGRGLTLARIAGIDRPAQDHFIRVRTPGRAQRIDRPDLVAPLRFPYPNIYAEHHAQRTAARQKALPDIFVTRESFGENIIYPLRESFGKSFFLFDEWKHQLNLRDYDREGGDIYLQLVWEGFLFNLLDVPDIDGKW